MVEILILYLFGFVATVLATWLPVLSWLASVSLLILLVGTFWLWQRQRYPIRSLGFRLAFSWLRNLFLGLLLGIVLVVVLVIGQTLVGWIRLIPINLSPVDFRKLVLVAVVKMALVVGVEELVFRGYFLQRFNFALKEGSALLFSSLLWALLHLPAMLHSQLSLTQVIFGSGTFCVWGVVLGTAFLRTDKTLWLPFGLHYGYNLSYSLLGSFLKVEYLAPTWIVGHPAWAPESGLLGLFVWSGILLFTQLKIRKRRMTVSRQIH